MALPTHISDEALEVDEGAVRAALSRVFRRILKPVVTGLGGLYCVFALGHPVFVGGTVGIVLALVAAATGLLLLGLRAGWARLPHRAPWPHALGTAVAGLVLANILLHLVLTDDPTQSTNVMLLLLGSGALMLSTPWYAGVTGATLAGWGLAVWITLPHPQLPHYGFAVVSAAALGASLHWVRRQSAWRGQYERLLGRALRGALAQSLRTEARTRAALEESNAALEKAVTEAEEVNRLQAAFLADMSHEIRTPLTSIIGFAEVLDDRASGEEGRFTSLILTSSRRLLDTLNSVLDLSKLDREEVHLEPERTDVGTEVRDTVRLFRRQAEEAGVSLEVEAPTPLPAALDPSALHRCCSNLVSNAVKYTGEGGAVTVRARAEADTVVVTVADTGVGIDPAFHDTLFDPFEQSDEGAQQKEGGTGLGLAITQRLASLMGGTIEVESTPGEGSAFTLRLPRWAHDGEEG
jgi:signal transduction histidine kinase